MISCRAGWTIASIYFYEEESEGDLKCDTFILTRVSEWVNKSERDIKKSDDMWSSFKRDKNST